VSDVAGPVGFVRRPALARLRRATIFLMPLVVGLAAASILAGLQSNEQTARETRLVLAQIHEDALLQQEIVTHAEVMGYLTPDLPHSLAVLKTSTDTNVSQLERIAGGAGAGAVATTWAAYHTAQVRTTKSLRVDTSMPTTGTTMKMAAPTSTMPAVTPSAAPSSNAMPTTAPSGSSMAMGATTPATATHGSSMPTGSAGTAPAPGTPTQAVAAPPTVQATFARFIAAINAASNAADARVTTASGQTRAGSVATVVLEALILALAFLWFALARTRAADASRRALAESEARFRSLVQNASDVVMVLSPDQRIEYVTPSVLGLVGLDADTVQGRRIAGMVNTQDRTVLLAFLHEIEGDHSGGSRSVEFRIKHDDGRWITVEALATRPRDGSDLGLILTMRDTTERKKFEEQLTHQAFHDALTGLPNRALFHDRLGHALTRRSDDASTVAILFLDLDDFKTVNDSLGHEAGDEILVEVADRLQRCLRSSDTPARLGGDEFAVLLEGISDISEAVEAGQRIIAALERPLRLRGREITTTASIGISLGLPHISDAQELLRDADTAMYAAKGRGRGSIEVFQEMMHEIAHDRLSLKSDLEGALVRGEFVVHYQPTVNLNSGDFTGFEALVRWQHPDRGLVPPLEFIPLCEETGLIVPLGGFVLNSACRQAVSWQQTYPARNQRTMSVNVSVKQLESPGFVEEVRVALDSSGLEPNNLVLEITEGVLLRETDEIAARLRELKVLGVQLAIDDFGTGYSSLSYLQTLPLDVLKIDKRFVDNVSVGANNAALASAIIAIGQALGMQTVAEGIEREEQANTLRRLHCQSGQGYMFARPLDPAGIEALLAAVQSDQGPGASRRRPRKPSVAGPTATELKPAADTPSPGPRPVPETEAEPASATSVAAARAAEIRAWARCNGIELSSRGPIPAAARTAYVEAHR